MDTSTGTTRGRSWRSASGWFSYELRAPAGTPAELLVTYWEGRWETRGIDGEWETCCFDIFANEHLIAGVTLGGSEQERLYDQSYPVPADVAAADGLLRVKSTTGAIYGVRLMKPTDL